MSDPRLPTPHDPEDEEPQPEVRLELTRAGVEQVLSLYAPERGAPRYQEGFAFRLEDLERAVRERRGMLVGGLVGGVFLGLLVSWLSTPIYPVSAQVVIERHEMSSDGSATAPVAGSAFVATQAEVLQSRSVVERALGPLPRPAHLDEDDDPVADAMESLRVSPVSGTQVVALGYLGPDPQHGVRLLGSLVDSYRAELRESERRSQAHKLEAKQAEVDALEAEAAEVERRLEALLDENEILGSAAEAALAQAEVVERRANELAEVRDERIALEKRLATGGELLAVLDPAVRSLQEQLWEAEAELARVRLTLQPRHPAVEAARHEVTVLRQQLRESSKATPEALRRDIEATRGLEEQMAALHAEERGRLAELERHRRAEGHLLEELEQIREMADARRRELLDQRLVTRLADSGEVTTSARLIEAPRPPLEASWPRPKVLVAGGGCLGLAAGLLAALVSLQRQRAQKGWAAAAPPHATLSKVELP